jgi:hypothetical protein
MQPDIAYSCHRGSRTLGVLMLQGEIYTIHNKSLEHRALSARGRVTLSQRASWP